MSIRTRHRKPPRYWNGDFVVLAGGLTILAIVVAIVLVIV
jgi:hypothetical protein